MLWLPLLSATLLLPAASTHGGDCREGCARQHVLDGGISALLQKSVQRVHEALQEEEKNPYDSTKALEYCDKESLARMHGANHTAGAREKFQQDVMEDITKEMKSNNVDQMAKDIFSFYVCVRWVPDEVFWNVAKEELAAEIIKTVVDNQEDVEQAISELYQTFKFVPLLCSRNLAVYEERDANDSTYYSVFKRKAEELSRFMNSEGPVWKSLQGVDEAFCGGDRMNSAVCDAKVTANDWLARVAGHWSWAEQLVKTREDRWRAMHLIFESFKLRGTEQERPWDRDFASWKERFPFHSFIAKPGGAAPEASPKSAERFLVCFGKRVASELHRRPAGKSIFTDQNSVGCHGWWDRGAVAAMLARTAALWKPPTCQLAEKTYEMKKAILRMYAKLNKDLYGALPSMLQDEELEAKGLLEEALAGPEPYNVERAELNGEAFYEGMRLAKIGDSSVRKASCAWWEVADLCNFKIAHGAAGTVVVRDGKVKVLWDSDPEKELRDVSTEEVQVVPMDYGRSAGGILDSVRGTLDAAKDWFGGVLHGALRSRYTNLAAMMTGSLSKWVVCGIAANASYSDLDSWLGTEDEALQEHVNEAYGEWSGYKAKVPGEQCRADEAVAGFPKCEVCDYSELHVDHPEEYWEDGEKQDFACPLVPPMSAADQLRVFKKKRKCLLHMTAEQQRQFRWRYQGHWPARRQHEAIENAPQEEYEYVQLLDIGDDAGPEQVSYGRTCSVEEQKANPRFCTAPVLQNPWPSVSEMAKDLSTMLGGALGMPYGAVAGIVGNYQRVLGQQNATEAVTALGEQAWDALLGIGRLAHSAAASAGNKLLYELPGSSQRHARIERELFAFSHAGELLHGAAFQAEGALKNSTSNSRKRFRRYAVACDCDDFDPGLALALRWEWSELALRALREAARHDSRIMAEVQPVVELRGEARLFWHPNKTHFAYGAAVRPVLSTEKEEPIRCDMELTWTGRHCIPEEKCEIKDWRTCAPKALPEGGKDEWRVVWDGRLAERVGGNPVTLSEGPAPLQALTLHFFCGPKSAFNTTGGGPAGLAPRSLKACAEAGVRSNAEMKAREPWRLYFPEEVIVVADFGTLHHGSCLPTDARSREPLCGGGLQEQAGLDAHLDAASREPGVAGGDYAGLRTGGGFPKGAVREVLLRPEDVLTVNGLLLPS